MLFRRYEISLPTTYPDGSPVEDEHFGRCWLELTQRFGAITVESHPLLEIWAGRGVPHAGATLKLSLEIEDTAEAAEFFRVWKETLKRRFRQIDIWIVSYEIRFT